MTCEYDTSSSPPPLTDITPAIVTNDDHNYNAHNLIVVDQCEPPAFIIKQVRNIFIFCSIYYYNLTLIFTIFMIETGAP